MILIINCVGLAAGAIALGLCMFLYYKAEKKAAYYCAKEKETFERLKHLTAHCTDLNSKLLSYEENVKAAYELGCNESKSAVQQKTAKECYEKVLEWYPVTKTDKYSYSQFIELFEQWLEEKYDFEVKDGE
jgi:hypothetical protein